MYPQAWSMHWGKRSSQPPDRLVFSRRGVIAVSVSTLTAGCSSFLRPGSGESSPWRLPTRTPPEHAQFNWFNDLNRGPIDLVFDPLASYDPLSDTWLPRVFRSWTFDSEMMRAEIDTDYRWANGDSVTARDIVTHLRLLRLVDSAAEELIVDAYERGEHAVEIEIRKRMKSPSIVEHVVLRHPVTTHRDRFRELADRVVTSTGNRESVIAELSSRRIDDPIANGPYDLASRTEHALQFTRREGYPGSSRITPRTVEQHYVESNSDAWEKFRKREFDVLTGLRLSEPQRDQLSPNQRHFSIDALGGIGLFLQYDHRWLGDPRVRRGIAHGLNWHEIVSETGKTPVASENGLRKYTGINNSALSQTWSGISSEDLLSYTRSPSKASRLFRSAGLNRIDGQWVAPDGSTFEIPISVAASWGTGAIMARKIAEQLRAIGIEASIERLGINTFSERWGSGEYVAAISEFRPYGWHPYFHYAYAFDSEAARRSWRIPPRFELDEMDQEQTGGESPIAPVTSIARYQSATTTRQRRRAITDLATCFNRTLPWLPLSKRQVDILVDATEWSYRTSRTSHSDLHPFLSVAPELPAGLVKRGMATRRQGAEENASPGGG